MRQPCGYGPGHNVCFRSAGDEELNSRNIPNRLSQHEEDRRFWVFISALVESVNHNNGRNIRRSERFNQKLLHLVLERLVDNVRIGLEERNERGPKAWVPPRKLERQRGEDKLEVTAILDTSRTEERRSQTAIDEHPFCDRLCDRGFSCPREPVEPEDRRFVEILCPPLDLVQHALSGTIEATAPTPMPTFGPLRTAAAV